LSSPSATRRACPRVSPLCEPFQVTNSKHTISEYQAAPGETCYFLDSFKHTAIDESADIKTHIDAAILQINSESEK
jgi:hypothetical protein